MLALPIRRLGVGFALVAGALGTACGRVIAPAPPTGAADASEIVTVAGPPIAVAARAARILSQFTFITRRFGPDSTWGFQAADKIHARFRYTRPHPDSTRVLLELWGQCGKVANCDNEYGRAILAALGASEISAPPR